MARVTTPAATLPPPVADAAPSRRPGGATRAPRRKPADLPTIARLRDFMPHDGLRSWILTLAIGVLAFLIRVVDLHNPSYLIFDETYYAKDAYSMMKFGYERDWPDAATANPSVANGTPDIMKDSAEFFVHPPLGKWLIASGEALFGMNSFGWRIAACVFGALLVMMTMRLARRVARSTLVGAIAGILLTVDGLAFVMSRIALLDGFQAFFIVAAVAALVADRDWFRNKLADTLTAAGASDLGGGFGPRALWRPWRWVAGIMFGLACGTKWNSIYVVAVFGLVTVLWDVGARRLAGAGFKSWAALGWDGLPAFVAVVGGTIVAYTATWAGWFSTAGGWDRDWGSKNLDHPLVKTFGQTIASWFWLHKEIYEFHTGDFINHATHPYNANPWGWLLMLRPIGIDAVNDIKPGTDGCVIPAGNTSANCLRVISGMGTPLLWWAAAVALVVACVWWLAGRDWRFGVPVLGVAATWLPWCLSTISETRPLFFFYGIIVLPFTVIGLALVLGLILGRARARGRRRGAIIVGLVVALIMVDFGYIYPILTDRLMPYSDWFSRMWLQSWI